MYWTVLSFLESVLRRLRSGVQGCGVWGCGVWSLMRRGLIRYLSLEKTLRWPSTPGWSIGPARHADGAVARAQLLGLRGSTRLRYIYIYIYIHRERDVYIYIYIYWFVYLCIIIDGREKTTRIRVPKGSENVSRSGADHASPSPGPSSSPKSTSYCNMIYYDNII